MLPETDALLRALANIVHDAGQRIMAVYETDFEVDSKSDASPVTAADLAANEVIATGLEALTPSIPILSEESSQVPFAERVSWHQYWLIDPLDGTREFIKQNGEFTVNIALVRQHKPVIGIVYVPITGMSYFAWENGGAFKTAKRGAEPVRIYTRPLGDEPVRVAGSRSYAVKPLQTFLRRLDNYEYVGVGAALKTCLIAEGRIDVYPRLGPTSEWDTAAAQCILQEAGGQVTDVHLRPLVYNSRPSLTNPPFIAFGDERRNWTRYVPERFLEDS